MMRFRLDYGYGFWDKVIVLNVWLFNVTLGPPEINLVPNFSSSLLVLPVRTLTSRLLTVTTAVTSNGILMTGD